MSKRKSTNDLPINSQISNASSNIFVKSEQVDFITIEDDDDDDYENTFENKHYQTSSNTSIVNSGVGQENSKLKSPNKIKNTHSSKQPAQVNDEPSSPLGNFENPFDMFLTETMQLVKELGECLRNIRGENKDFVMHGQAHELPTLLGLELKDFGPIKCPLSAHHAQELASICYKKASDQHGGELILIDKNVRSISHVSIKNPEWDLKLKQLVRRIMDNFGLDCELETRLEKVLFYTKGSRVSKKRENRDKEKNYFGDLVIQLPSKYTGGQIVIGDGLIQKTIDLGQNEGKSEFSVFFVAYLNGLDYELLEILSGHRFVLVYSLYKIKENTPRLSDSLPPANQISKIFSTLSSNPFQFAILLENQYTDEQFSKMGIKALKNVDFSRYDLLNLANCILMKQKRFKIYVCQALLEVESQDMSRRYSRNVRIDQNNSYVWQEVERKISLKNWHDVNGTSMFVHSKFGLEFFTIIINPKTNSADNQIDWYDLNLWGKKIKEEFFLENEPQKTTKLVKKKSMYSRFLLACLPELLQFEIFIGFDLAAAIDLLQTSLIKDNNNKTTPSSSDCEKFEKILIEWENKNNDLFKLDAGLVAEYHKKISSLIPIFENMSYLLEFLKNEPTFNKDTSLFKQTSPLVKSNSVKISKMLELESTAAVSSSANLENPVGPGVEYLAENLNIIMNLLSTHRVDRAKFCFEKYVMPILNNEIEFAKIQLIFKSNLAARFSLEEDQNDELPDEILSNISIDQPVNPNYIGSIYFRIAKVIISLGDRYAQVMVVYANILIKKLDVEHIRSLVEEFTNEWDFFKKCKPIRILFLHRKQWLEQNIKNKLEFCWNMPDVIMSDHPVVEEFLKSNKKSMTYAGNFPTFKELLDFCRKCERSSCLAAGYTVKMEPLGIKPDSLVTITKTTAYFHQIFTLNEKYKKELLSIIKLIQPELS